MIFLMGFSVSEFGRINLRVSSDSNSFGKGPRTRLIQEMIKIIEIDDNIDCNDGCTGTLRRIRIELLSFGRFESAIINDILRNFGHLFENQ